MTRVWHFLKRPLWGATVGRWLAFAAIIAVLAAVWQWAALCALPPWLLSLRRQASAPAPSDQPDPAPSALQAHSAAQATQDALRGVAAEEATAGLVAREAAQTDPLDEVAARVEARARERKP